MWTFLFSFSAIRSVVGATALAGLGASLFLGINPSSHSLALSGVIAQLEEITSYSADILIDAQNPDPTRVALSYAEPGHLRVETYNSVTVILNREEKDILVLTGSDRAIRISTDGNMDEEIAEQFAEHLWLDKLRNYRGEAEELLGEREINGVMTNGFVLTVDDTKMTIWADVETELPIHILAEPLDSDTQITIDLAYDVAFGADHFSMEAPEGYQEMRIDTGNIMKNLSISTGDDEDRNKDQ